MSKLPPKKMQLWRFEPEIKEWMLAICAQDRISMQALMTRAVTEYIHAHLPTWDIKLPEPALCRNCFEVLKNRDNESGFCRNCQRKYGLPTLRKIHGAVKL